MLVRVNVFLFINVYFLNFLHQKLFNLIHFKVCGNCGSTGSLSDNYKTSSHSKRYKYIYFLNVHILYFLFRKSNPQLFFSFFKTKVRDIHRTPPYIFVQNVCMTNVHLYTWKCYYLFFTIDPQVAILSNWQFLK